MSLPWWFGIAVSFMLALVRYRWPLLHPRLASAGIGGILCGSIAGLAQLGPLLVVSAALNGALSAAFLDSRYSGRPALGDSSKTAYRRGIISSGRRIAHQHTINADGEFFREYLEKSSAYPRIRPHLSAQYLNKLHAPRTVYVGGGGAYDPLVDAFLRELERLEKKWGLA